MSTRGCEDKRMRRRTARHKRSPCALSTRRVGRENVKDRALRIYPRVLGRVEGERGEGRLGLVELQAVRRVGGGEGERRGGGEAVVGDGGGALGGGRALPRVGARGELRGQQQRGQRPGGVEVDLLTARGVKSRCSQQRGAAARRRRGGPIHSSRCEESLLTAEGGSGPAASRCTAAAGCAGDAGGAFGGAFGGRYGET